MAAGAAGGSSERQDSNLQLAFEKTGARVRRRIAGV
jgi:hypothetical protein